MIKVGSMVRLKSQDLDEYDYAKWYRQLVAKNAKGVLYGGNEELVKLIINDKLVPNPHAPVHVYTNEIEKVDLYREE
jgi:hypothetical protein